MKKKWKVTWESAHRSGVADVQTEVEKSEAFSYGNGMCGAILAEDGEVLQIYDLRYSRAKDLHMQMLETYYGENLIKAEEIE